jgi:hypothetical protein
MTTFVEMLTKKIEELYPCPTIFLSDDLSKKYFIGEDFGYLSYLFEDIEDGLFIDIQRNLEKREKRRNMYV